MSRFPERVGIPPQPTDLQPKWAGQFTTFETWLNKASSWIDGYAVCVDAKGRRCVEGRDFLRARDEDAFPVRFFWECEEPDDDLDEVLEYAQSEIDRMDHEDGLS